MMTFHEITDDGLVPALHLHGGHRLGTVSKTKAGRSRMSDRRYDPARSFGGTGISQCARRETEILTELELSR